MNITNRKESAERVRALLDYLKLRPAAFAQSLGKSRQNIYELQNAKYCLNKEWCDLICDRYPHISKMWLLTGQGEMLVNQDKSVSLKDVMAQLNELRERIETIARAVDKEND